MVVSRPIRPDDPVGAHVVARCGSACVSDGTATGADADVAGVDPKLIQADVRDFEVDAPAALIYCPFRALSHVPTWADRRRVFERMAASLQLGGRFALNAFAFDHHIAVRYDGSHRDAPVPHSMHHDVPDNRVDLVLGGGGTSSFWWATKKAWLGLIDVAGLTLEALGGGFDGEPLTPESREYVCVVRR